MSTSNNSQKDEFQLNIDSAIDNLFAPSRKIEIDPQTGEVKEMTAPEEAPISLSLEKDADDSSVEISFDQPDIHRNPNEELLEQLNQSFMALDWEISSANIKNFQELLKKFNSLFKLDSQGPTGKVVILMDRVLEAMATTPDELPTTAVKTLQKGLVILREAADSEQENMEAVASLARKTIADLDKILAFSQDKGPAIKAPEEPVMMATKDSGHADLPVAAGGEDMSFPEEMLLEIPEEPLPLELSNAINFHLTILSQCINRILPLEHLFSQNPRYGKLLSRHREIRELFEEEKDIITAVLISDHSSSAKSPGTNIPIGLFRAIEKHLAALQKSNLQLQSLEKAFGEKKGYEKLSNIEKSIQLQLRNQLDTLKNLLKGNFGPPEHIDATVPAEISAIVAKHIGILSGCVKNILPMENLFAKTKGYEKLHGLQKRIRMQLSEQEALLSKALAGTSQGAIAPISASHKNEMLQETETPPWQVLRLGFWGGEKVAFVPAQIALETYSTAWAKKLNTSDMTSLSLKNLRKWPWTKLKPLFRNDLAQLDENELASMNVPVLNNPSPLKRKPVKSGKEALLILSHGENWAAASLDGPTEELLISPSHRWQPTHCAGNKILTGYLITNDGTIPVLSL